MRWKLNGHCPNGFSNRHEYRPRYDYEIVANKTKDRDEFGPRDLVQHVTLQTKYIYDICTKCGEKVTRI